MKLHKLENPKKYCRSELLPMGEKYINILDVNISIPHSIICPIQNIKIQINRFPYK